MTIREFPSVETADSYGLLAIGGDLEVDSLLLAYRSGIFPWPLDENHLLWFAPPKRMVLFLKDFHISKSLKKELRTTEWKFVFNKNFEAVIKACSELARRPTQTGTWITQDIIKAYINFHKMGFAHSVECYDGDELIGGLYGTSIGKTFAGESMFYRKPNASKLCVCHLVEHLRTKKVEWIDCQVKTPLFTSFGATEIPRDEFMKLLKDSLKKKGTLFW